MLKIMKTEHTQTEFAFPETVMHSQNPNPKYTPPRPKEMTNEELEEWLIVNPCKGIKREIMKRINAGVKFPRVQIRNYLGMKPFLVWVTFD